MHYRRNNLAKRPIANIAARLLIAIALPAASTGQDTGSELVRGVDDPELTELLELVGERVREYYRDIENLAWTTTVRHEVFEDDWSPKEAPKDLVFESIVLLEPPPDDFPVPFVVREESDLTHVDGASVDPGYELESDFLYRYQLHELSMLLPEYRATWNYVFSYAGRAELEGRPAFVIDVEQPRSPDDEPRIVWRGRRFSIYNLVFTRRIWIDPETYDVLRFDTEAEPVSFRRFLIFGRIGYEQTSTTRYTTVAFDDTEMGVSRAGVLRICPDHRRSANQTDHPDAAELLELSEIRGETCGSIRRKARIEIEPGGGSALR